MSLTQILKTFDDEKEIVKVAPNKYKEVDKGEPCLKGILQRARLKKTKEKAHIPRGVSFAPHAATFPFCKRAKVGQLAGFIQLYYEKQTPATQTGMDIGTSLHNQVQDYFWDVGLLKGTFECLKCDKKYDNVVSPNTCPSGKKTHTRKHLIFREVIASNPTYLLYGRSDGLLVIEGEPVLEIKSLPVRPAKNANDFQFYFDYLDERGPKEDHIIQLQLYLFMLDKDAGHLFYICKNDGRIKTFYIRRDNSIIESFLNEITYLNELAVKLKAGEKVLLPECCGNDKCSCHLIISPMPVS